MESRKILVAALLLVATSLPISAAAKNMFVVTYDEPSKLQEAQALEELNSSNLGSMLDQFVNSSFTFKRTLKLTFGNSDGSSYDSETNQIFIPYQFLIDTKERFRSITASSKDELSAEDATIDAVMHTVFHELAHALIFMNEIPIVGREEDAADSLATILLIDYFEDGQEIALSGAELFNLESSAIDEYDLAGEHSLDAQRYYQIVCYIYGSAPEKYSSVLEDGAFTDERAQLCLEEYENASRSWNTLLTPIFKAP